MKTPCFVFLLTAILASCGATDSDETKMVEGCVLDGPKRGYCECIAREAKKALDPEVFALMAKGAAKNNLTPEEADRNALVWFE